MGWILKSAISNKKSKSKKIMCTDGIERTEKEYGEWLTNLQELALSEPNDLTEEEFTALQNEGLIY